MWHRSAAFANDVARRAERDMITRCSIECWAGRECRCPRSVSARGRSADRGARWTTRSRCGRCTPRSTAASTSSTRRTCTGTGGASVSWRDSAANGRARPSTWRPRPAAGCPSRRRRATARAQSGRTGSIAACGTSRSDTIDLLQLHCPPSAVFGDAGVYRHPRRPRHRREDSALRRQRGARGRGARRDPPSRRRRRFRSSSTCSASSPPKSFFPEALRRAGRRPRARAARERPADGQADRRVDVRGRRSSEVQSRRRGVRQGRDVLGRALRRRAARRRGAAAARARRLDAGTARAALDADVRRGHLRDSRRPDARSRRARTRRPPTCRRSTARRWRVSRGPTTSTFASMCTICGRPIQRAADYAEHAE